MTFVNFKGATGWEAQIGCVWLFLRFRRFWSTSGIGFIRIIKKDADE